MSNINMTGWPALTDEARAVVLECVDTLAREAAGDGRDPAVVFEAAEPFGRSFAAYRGAAFQARVTRYEAAGGTTSTQKRRW